MAQILRRLGLGAERRKAARLRLPVAVIVSVGRLQGSLVDIGPGGARVQSLSALKRDEQIRFSLRFRHVQIELNAVVVGSRVIALRPSVTYEMRLQFLHPTAETEASVVEFARQIEDVRRRNWTRRSSGYTRETATPRRIIATFIQLVRTPAGWQEMLTFEPDQPPEGLTIPTGTPTGEVMRLCQAYDNADEPGRERLRERAAADCEQATADSSLEP